MGYSFPPELPYTDSDVFVSTTVAAKDIFAAAAAAVDEKVAEAVRREKNWRFGYTRHVVQNLTLCARSQVRTSR